MVSAIMLVHVSYEGELHRRQAGHIVQFPGNYGSVCAEIACGYQPLPAIAVSGKAATLLPSYRVSKATKNKEKCDQSAHAEKVSKFTQLAHV